MYARYGAIALISLAALLPLTISCSEGAPEDLSLVMVELDQDIITIDVSPSGNGTAMITGRVTLPYPLPPRVEYVDVFLEPEIPDYAGLILTPTEVRLSKASPEAHFHGNLTAPSSLSASLDGTVRIGGSAILQPSGTPAAVSDDGADIEILSYYGATMFFQKVFGKLDTDGTGTFLLQINNTGNADDSYSLSLLDPAELSKSGISVEFERDIDIPEKGSVQVKVVVKAHNADRGMHVIRIDARSRGKGGSEPEPSVALLTITVEDRVLSFLKGSPYTLIGIIACIVLSIALISAGTSLLLRRRRWRKQFQGMMEAAARENRGLTPPPPRTPPPG